MGFAVVEVEARQSPPPLKGPVPDVAAATRAAEDDEGYHDDD